MRPVPINQVQTPLDRQLTQFRDSENFNKLISLFSQELQNIEDVYFDLLNNRSIFTAIGQQLDIIGKILGEERRGRSDNSYRAGLLLRVLSDNSSGTPNEILEVIRSFTSAGRTEIWEHLDAAFVILTNGSERVDGSSVELLNNIKPAGVKGILVHEELGTEIIPAWLVHSTNEEDFQVTDSLGVLHDLEVVPSIGEVCTLVVNAGVDVFDTPDFERSLPLWLEPYDFELFDGCDLELSTGDILSVVSSLSPTEVVSLPARVAGERLVDDQGRPISFETERNIERASLVQLVREYTT